MGMTLGHLPDCLVNAFYHNHQEHVWLRDMDLNHFQDTHSLMQLCNILNHTQTQEPWPRGSGISYFFSM